MRVLTVLLISFYLLNLTDDFLNNSDLIQVYPSHSPQLRDIKLKTYKKLKL